MSFASVDAQIRTESAEAGMAKLLSEIRSLIGERILKKENEDAREDKP